MSKSGARLWTEKKRASGTVVLYLVKQVQVTTPTSLSGQNGPYRFEIRWLEVKVYEISVRYPNPQEKSKLKCP